MVMTHSSAFHPPPPPPSLNSDIRSQLLSLVSCLEKLLPFLSVQPINHKDEKSMEIIPGEDNLVHLEEADDVKPKAMEIGAESVETNTSQMTKQQTTPTQPHFTGLSAPPTSPKYPQNWSTTLSQQNRNHQLQQGTQSQELGHGDSCVIRGNKIFEVKIAGLDSHSNSPYFPYMSSPRRLKNHPSSLKQVEPMSNYVGAVT